MSQTLPCSKTKKTSSTSPTGPDHGGTLGLRLFYGLDSAGMPVCMTFEHLLSGQQQAVKIAVLNNRCVRAVFATEVCWETTSSANEIGRMKRVVSRRKTSHETESLGANCRLRCNFPDGQEEEWRGRKKKVEEGPENIRIAPSSDASSARLRIGSWWEMACSLKAGCFPRIPPALLYRAYCQGCLTLRPTTEPEQPLLCALTTIFFWIRSFSCFWSASCCLPAFRFVLFSRFAAERPRQQLSSVLYRGRRDIEAWHRVTASERSGNFHLHTHPPPSHPVRHTRRLFTS